MQKSRRIFSAVAIVATLASLSSAAEARHYRHAESELANVCGPVPASATLYIYPDANWQPFFRRHMYRFGPLVACSMVTSSAISARY
jgi:hypothetical protein